MFAPWLVGWLAGWFVIWLVGWSAGWLVGWLVGWFVGMFLGWLIGGLRTNTINSWQPIILFTFVNPLDSRMGGCYDELAMTGRVSNNIFKVERFESNF